MVTIKLAAFVSKSYFMHNNNRVIGFCDPPHLVKNSVDTFLFNLKYIVPIQHNERLKYMISTNNGHIDTYLSQHIIRHLASLNKSCKT